MKKRVLVTGVNGFLGRTLWKYLKQKTSWDVYGLDIEVNTSSSRIYKVNLKNSKKLRDVLTIIKPDYIFHCAGGRAVGKKKLLDLNYSSTKHLLEAVKKEKECHTRVIIPGSAAEYGKMMSGKRIIREEDRSKPMSDYGEAKLKQTQLALNYAKDGLDVVIARIFNIMGEGTPTSLAVGRFASQIVDIERGIKEGVIRTKNLVAKRDFLDVQDVCRGLVTIAQYGRSGQIYNVCSGRPLKIRDLLRELLSYAKVDHISIDEDKNDSSLSFDMIGSNRKLRSMSKWRPKVEIKQSLKNTLYSYRSMN